MSYEVIRAQLTSGVPFAAHCGVSLDEIGNGRAAASLPFRKEGLNHIGAQHAAALFAVGEAASGAAMAGAFSVVLLGVRPVAAEASIRYFKSAKGDVRAEATIQGDPEELMKTLHGDGKITFPVNVDLLDSASGEKLAEMTVRWHVTDISKPKVARS
jgi:acyl-coenzyme A thioesterase PaaI-like protein